MADRASPTEALLVDAIREEAARTDLAGVLLIGMHARSTVQAVNGLLDAERVTLLHLDRAPEAVGCGLGNREWFIGDVPGPIEFVDVFRRPEFTPQIVEEAVAAGAKAVWLQQGIRNEEARRKAEDAGLLFVQDRCVLQEHQKMMRQGLV